MFFPATTSGVAKMAMANDTNNATLMAMFNQAAGSLAQVLLAD